MPDDKKKEPVDPLGAMSLIMDIGFALGMGDKEKIKELLKQKEDSDGV